MNEKVIRVERESPLGDTITTQLYYLDGKCVREDITIELPALSIELPKSLLMPPRYYQ